MATVGADDIEQGQLVDADTFESVIEGLAGSSPGSLVLEGSLLDYSLDEYPMILDFEPTTDGVDYRFGVDWPSTFPDEKQAEARNRIRDAFLRGGAATHLNINEVMSKLRNQDDVIIGVDGNILRDCIMTATLLERIYEETYPNWILVGIPRLVMSDIESAAKDDFVQGDHPRVGWPTYAGRVGQRALQEVMNLREKNPDRPGLAMMTIGELRKGTNNVQRDDWQVDALIRDQFKEFLDDIGFHKGTFFLSQNRVNVMMSGTEGGDALYLQKPEFPDVEEGNLPIADFAALLYELCVQFGTIRIRDQETDAVLLELSIYWPGKNVSDWEQGRMNVVTVRS